MSLESKTPLYISLRAVGFQRMKMKGRLFFTRVVKSCNDLRIFFLPGNRNSERRTGSLALYYSLQTQYCIAKKLKALFFNSTLVSLKLGLSLICMQTSIAIISLVGYPRYHCAVNYCKKAGIHVGDNEKMIRPQKISISMK